MRYLALLILPVILIGLVAYSQTSIVAKPLSLSIPLGFLFTVLNVVNTSYVGWNYTYPNQTILSVISHTYIQIVIENYSTGQVIATLTVYIPVSLANDIYYSPSMGSVIFLINISANQITQVPLSKIEGLPPFVYTYDNKPTSTINIIPLGYLICQNGIPVNQTTVFQKYLNGVHEIVNDMINGLAGYYVLYFYT